MRQAIADRLGLPENASNGAIFAAFDAAQAAKPAPAPVDPTEALSALAWGSDTASVGSDLTGVPADVVQALHAAGWAA